MMGLRMLVVAVVLLGSTAMQGCGGTGVNFLDNFVDVVVEPVGRSFGAFGDKIRINVPKGAFSIDVTFLITKILNLNPIIDILLDTVFDVRVNGGINQKNITITLRYDRQTLPDPVLEDALRIFRVVDGIRTLVPGSILNKSSQLVSAEVSDPNGTFVVGILK